MTYFRRAPRSDPFFVSTAAPELTAELRGEAYALLRRFDAVVGPTTDGGWYAFGLREPSLAPDLRALTAAHSLTLAALRLGLHVAMLPTLPAPAGKKFVSPGNLLGAGEH
ncbi:DUF2064 domain-containing protein [Actinoplanes sp. NPDC051346]|uniref:DUF2064 domain-containing protein n=1 Tax=Actinoplanes sp. NPDC051346 TaxID=3155048 RepID=UPI00342DBE0B